METFIINDIDVSECEYLKRGFCNCSGHDVVDEQGVLNKNALTFYLHCNENPNCYYKKLQQARIRIKDLEERIMKHADKIEEYCTKLATMHIKKTQYESCIKEIKLIIKFICVSENLENLKYYSNLALHKICEVQNVDN